MTLQPTRMTAPVFIIGAAHSGKSELAMRYLAPDKTALVIGTAEITSSTFNNRINTLKALRPPHWHNLEPVRDLASALLQGLSDYDQILIDSVNQWLAARVVEHCQDSDNELSIEKQIERETQELMQVMATAKSQRLVIVSSEVGAAPPPSHPPERLFRRILGQTNQRLAAHCASVIQVVAGLALPIKFQEKA